MEFNPLKDFIYLNSGTMALSPNVVVNAVQAYKKILEENPANGLVNAWLQMWASQKSLAHFLKTSPQNLYLRTNVTYAMNDFLMALQIPKGSEILVSNLEYGAIFNICRYKAELEGHEIKVMDVLNGGAKALEKLTEESFLKAFESQLKTRTRLAVFSHITTGSGFKFPVEKMAQICRAKNVVFAVDGAHGLGATPLDFSNTQIDFYGSNLHKWFMGPKGTGFAFVSPQVRDNLKPQFAGWTTYDTPPHFTLFGEIEAWAARWMICSTHNFSDFYGIKEIVEFWNQKGEKNIFHQQTKLRDFAAETLTQKTGWAQLALSDKSFAGPMVAFDLPDSLQAKGFELLFLLRDKYHVQVSMSPIEGRWYLRLAPHIYNSEAEISEGCDRIAKALQS